MSRLSVREATRTLAARGLLEISKGRRPRVAVPNGSLVGDFFQIALRRDPRALLDLLEVRRALEVHIAALAAQRATSGDIADMEMSINAHACRRHRVRGLSHGRRPLPRKPRRRLRQPPARLPDRSLRRAASPKPRNAASPATAPAEAESTTSSSSTRRSSTRSRPATARPLLRRCATTSSKRNRTSAHTCNALRTSKPGRSRREDRRGRHDGRRSTVARAHVRRARHGRRTPGPRRGADGQQDGHARRLHRRARRPIRRRRGSVRPGDAGLQHPAGGVQPAGRGDAVRPGRVRHRLLGPRRSGAERPGLEASGRELPRPRSRLRERLVPDGS